MTNEKIMTLHPHPDKAGVNISKIKYDQMRAAIEKLLTENGPMSYGEMTPLLADHFNGRFDGSINWYAVSVKLDLEARGVIERIPKTRPEQIRLVEQGA